MSRSIDTLGKAARHGMVLRAECPCGNLRYFRTRDLAAHYGGERDPYGLKFRCRACAARPEVVLLDLDHDCMPAINVWRPMRKDPDGPVVWMSERLR